MVAADLDCSGTATMLLTYGLSHVPLNVPAKLDKAGFISIFQNILLKKFNPNATTVSAQLSGNLV
jgi:hypothetical protein